MLAARAAGPDRSLPPGHGEAGRRGWGWRRSDGQKVRRGGRAVMWPPLTLPDTWIRRMTGTSEPMRPDFHVAAVGRYLTGADHNARLCHQRQPACAHISVDQQRRLRDHRLGEVQRHAAAGDPHFHPLRHEPAALTRHAAATAADAGQVLRLRCARGGIWPTLQVGGQRRQLAAVRAVKAASSRSSSSSAVSRPSPAATRSSSTTRSRSTCDARRPA